MVIRNIILMLSFCLMLAACDSTIHFYPEAENPDRSKVRINVDWSDYGKTKPTGMTVVCHHTETGEKVQTVNNEIGYVMPRLSAGQHWAAVFNLTEEEFGYIGFRGLDTAETAEAYALEQRSKGWYKGSDDAHDYVAGQLDWLAVDTIMTEHVDPLREDEHIIGTLHPKNIIYTLHITIHTVNIGNLKSARGAISGMANGRKFHSATPNPNTTTVTHLIESNSWTRTRSESNIGNVKADIQCFGLPGNHEGLADENILEFQAMLADGKTVLKYLLPVGNRIKEEDSPEGKRGDNLDLYLELWLDPPLPPGGDSNFGFDVWVEDWDEQEDTDIIFKVVKPKE